MKRALLRLAYPAFRWWAATFTKKGGTMVNKHKIKPQVPFHRLSATLGNGEAFDFKALAGKKVLLVNTASYCGYTHQYAGLQELSTRFAPTLAVIAFPSNDFGGQEPGSNEDIQQFCTRYEVSFPIAAKSEVLGDDRNAVFRWLTDPAQNGWNSQQPEWNFSKYLVDEQGVLTHYFGPAVAPGDIAGIIANP